MGNRLHGLEALRGIAALLVVYGHACFLAGFPDLASRLFVRAHIGVDLFFLLSGFVLTRAYEGRMETASGFLRMRFIRLWPPIAAGVLIGAVVATLAGTEPLRIVLGILSGMLMLPLVNYSIIFNGPAWSIFFELVANFVHALLLQRLSKRMLLFIAAICALVLSAHGPAQGLAVGQADTFWLGFPRLFMSYALGIVLYRVNRDRIWLPEGMAWSAILAWPVLISLHGYFLPYWADLVIALTVNPLALLAALSLRNSRVAVLLGALSFPLYALHFPIMQAARPLGFDWPLLFVLALAVSMAGGLAVDPRWRKAVFALFDGKKACSPAAA